MSSPEIDDEYSQIPLLGVRREILESVRELCAIESDELGVVSYSVGFKTSSVAYWESPPGMYTYPIELESMKFAYKRQVIGSLACVDFSPSFFNDVRVHNVVIWINDASLRVSRKIKKSKYDTAYAQYFADHLRTALGHDHDACRAAYDEKRAKIIRSMKIQSAG